MLYTNSDKTPLAKMSVHYSSKSTAWETPQDFYERLNNAYQFNLDPCATSETAKCGNYFTEEEDGLLQSWARRRAFMNPPYGRKIGKWVKKAYEEGLKPHTTVVCLLPARTDTKWWHDWIPKTDAILFKKGRVKFLLNGEGKGSSQAPSILVAMGNECVEAIKNFEGLFVDLR